MYKITGDIHGVYNDLKNRCMQNNVQSGDTLIVVGDVCANFFLSKRDVQFKIKANNIGVTLFCIHGNHEARPSKIGIYKTKIWNNGIVYYEEQYPNLLFAKDGEVYNIDGKKTMVCGGAYSVDKYYRLFKMTMLHPELVDESMAQNIKNLADNHVISKDKKKSVDDFADKTEYGIAYWFNDEQPSNKIKKTCEDVLEKHDWNIDVVLSHTSPIQYEPVEVFLNGLNQELVDKTTENWLGKIEKKLKYDRWYAGHYHTEKTVNGKFVFLYTSIIDFGNIF